MKERPILFSAPMVRAILAGKKTQTRRVVARLAQVGPIVEFGVSDTAGYAFTFRNRHALWNDVGPDYVLNHCPYGAVGDRLWVRETWRPFCTDGAIYLADAGTHRLNAPNEAAAKAFWPGWKPSIHMPRRHSRITLEITGVRVERLNQIGIADARAEGFPADREEMADKHEAYPIAWYVNLWESINGVESWAANPWVWVIEFKTAGA